MIFSGLHEKMGKFVRDLKKDYIKNYCRYMGWEIITLSHAKQALRNWGKL